jgi:hypothetical protein
MKKWKMVEVVERYTDEKGLRRLKLSCGHIKTDPIEFYGNEAGFQIRLLGQLMDEKDGKKTKARCYKCAKEKK